MPKSHPNRILVPQRSIQGGFDLKFESDPYDVDLKGLMTNEQYTDAITKLNDFMRPSRSGAVDKALLATGPLLVPLALWGVRHSNQTRRRKRLLHKGIEEFNNQNPTLMMRWNRRPDSMLTIERRPAPEEPLSEVPSPSSQVMAHTQMVPSSPIPVNNNAPQGPSMTDEKAMAAVPHIMV